MFQLYGDWTCIQRSVFNTFMLAFVLTVYGLISICSLSGNFGEKNAHFVAILKSDFCTC